MNARLAVTSRSDSTMRGHFPLETDVLRRTLEAAGRHVDGVVLCPAFIEAGRLTVDDVQWADAPSLRYLAYLARRLDGLPVLLAVTARTGEPSSDETLLADVGAGAAARIVPLPLSLDATGALLHADQKIAAHRRRSCQPDEYHQQQGAVQRAAIQAAQT